MNDTPYESFVSNIVSNLNKNGYPSKRVALPLERLYESAYEKGLNFNKALTLLEEQGISHEKTAEKVIFFPKESLAAESKTPSMNDMMAEAQRTISAMSAEERQKLMSLFQNMTPEQQAEIVKKAKDMGLG